MPHPSPVQTTSLPHALWALMVGNVVIGTGVMMVPGALNDISRSLAISIPQAGQLITAAAILMGVGAPLFAGIVAGWDRRKLLTISLLWYGVMTGISALAPDYASLLPLRILTVIAPAIFTPQAAASVGLMVSPAQRGRAITFVFLGWSVASVMGMPLSAWIAGVSSWRWAFALVAVSSIVVAIWIWRVMPSGIRPAALTRRAWGQTLGSPTLMVTLSVTLTYSFGQFILFSYFAPYLNQTIGATSGTLALMFLWFGVFGLAGNLGLSRWVDRVGTARAVLITLGLIALSLLLWPLGRYGFWPQALIAVPWALGCFSSNSAQQARLVQEAPELAPATVALNTSAMYGGQAMGAALGGILIAHGHMLRLHQVSLVVMLTAMALSLWAARIQKRSYPSK
ncbi:MFS transporter [Hydrogenophaga sp. PAMC20947]|uniref:MFS transporter n=1 Tax=Hydrogenophaga sp. PAMC20947 TaxID=2565558 RepID=UPI00109D943F|nr:MFS transporter [Hydrogenophaga sp. PAMC20947]QCB48246.1 MFS transporter [Hydrogenophaga sp. PAMC20947]